MEEKSTLLTFTITVIPHHWWEPVFKAGQKLYSVYTCSLAWLPSSWDKFNLASNHKINNWSILMNSTVESCTLNLSWSASMSSFTLWISWVWYSRMAPRMCGRTNRALNLEKILNISFAFLAVPSWSRRRAVIRVSTLSIRSSYLEYNAVKF